MSTTTRNGKLERIPFEMPRAAEYFDLDELQTMTGRPRAQFAAVALKELADNGLDAAEAAGVAPAIRIGLEHAGGSTRIRIADNAHGIPPDLVGRVLDFSTRTSDKASYRSPSRGQLGNALKTILGMPFAFGLDDPVTVEAHGLRHVVRAGLDPAGQVRQQYRQEKSGVKQGTVVGLTLPRGAFVGVNPALWARSIALFNPHAEVGFCETGAEGKQR
jgi:DNA topoisomerase VI subunit B